MYGCLIISNILASKTFVVGTIVLPTAVIIFPIVYIVNDILAEVYGYSKTRNVVLLGFLMNLIAVIAYNIAIKLPSPVFGMETSNAFELVLSSTPRILFASFSAYIIGSLVNAKVMQYLKRKLEKQLMFRCMLSTVVGEGLDAIIFIIIVFAGTMSVNNLLTMIIAQALFKIIFEFIFYPITKVTILKIKKLKN